jgi:hypothetical protein
MHFMKQSISILWDKNIGEKKYHYIHPEGLVNHFQIVMLTDVNVNIDITSQFSFNVQ